MHLTITISIQGQLLDPGEITELLHVAPHVSRRKGDISRSPSGNQAIAHTGLWEWRLTDAAESHSLSELLHQVHRTFLAHINRLQSLPNAEDSLLDIHMVTDSREDGDTALTMTFDRSAIDALAEIGLPTTMTIDRLLPDINSATRNQTDI